jgi:enediyne polyketide synthase
MDRSIAIVGLACVYPDARSPAELWESVLAKRRTFRPIPAERLRAEDYLAADRKAPDRTYVARAAVIEGYRFDRSRFSVAAGTYAATDLSHWLALDVAASALEAAGFPDGRGLPRDRTGVLIGNSLTGEFSRANVLRLRWPYVRRAVEETLAGTGLSGEDRRKILEGLEARYKAPFPPAGDETLAGGLSNTIAGRICNHFDLHGGGYTVDGACASSLLAVANSCSALAAGDLDVALAGGVDLSLDPFELVGFAKVGVLAEEEMRIYDARPTGFWPGEGCGIAVLMRREDALARGLPIRASIRGWGISSDGRGGLTRPEPEGQILALRRAYRRAGFGIDTVPLFEGHGTGTDVGDATELATLTRAIREARGEARQEPGARPASPPAAIGSIKANIGHTKAAAGIAGILKATLAVEEGILPPTTGCRMPHRELTGDRPALRVLEDAEPWPAGTPPRAGISSMGFGGINVHIVLEGERPAAPAMRGSPRLALAASEQDAEVLLFAGKDAGEVLDRVRRVLERAGRLSIAEAGDLAAELARGAGDGRFRAAVVAAPLDLAGRLDALAALLASGRPERIDPAAGIFAGPVRERPGIGLLFPGQASPAYPDGGALARRFPSLRDVHRMARIPGASDPRATDAAQPAIAASSLIGIRALDRLGIEARIAVGHSVGELGALCWAEVFDGEAYLRIAAERGRLMAALGRPGGTMAGIAAGSAEVEALIAREPVVLAGINSPRQTVVAGEAAAVERVCRRAGEKGIRATVLPVSHAFHSPFMDPVRAALAAALAAEAFAPPRRTVVSTIAGRALADGDRIGDLLVRQLASPVLFVEALTRADPGVDLWIEAGPGSVLSRLAGESVETPAVALDAGGQSIGGLLLAAAGAFVLGAPLKLEALFEGRLLRPFDLDRRPRFFASPCEAGPADGEPEGAVAEVAGPAAGEGEATPLDAVRAIVARRLDLPREKVLEGSRLLGDLHLNSIAVGEIVVAAARALGLPPPRSLTEYAGATVGELARALDDLRRTAGPKEEVEGPFPPGVDGWTRRFAIEWEERPAPSSRDDIPGEGWEVLAPAGCALAAELSSGLGGLRRGGGIAVVLPDEPDRESLGLLLRGAKAALRKEGVFLLVHRGIGPAFAKTLHLERPGLRVLTVEVEPGCPAAAEKIAAEALGVAGFAEVRYDAEGRRTEPALRHVPLREPPAPVIARGDVVAVTGGGKGIAAECALALARDTGARLALLGRSRPEADAALAANLRRMAEAGVDARYWPADVTDAAAVRRAVREAEAALGPIAGLVHGAGVNVPRLIESLDEETLHATLAPKVGGLRNLLEAVDPGRLRLLAAFGSIIARIGLPGEADYALANEWLSWIVERFGAGHPDCRSISLEWSVWSGVGMGQRLGRVEALAREGIAAIPPDRGIAVFREAAARPAGPGPVVVTGRFGSPPTVRLARRDLPLLRFLERPRVHVPGVELVVDATLSTDHDPYLADHEVSDQRIFPAVMILEAMAGTTMALARTERLPVFEGVEFRRALVVPRDGSLEIRLAALARDPERVDVVLRSGETGFAADHAVAACLFGSVEEPLPPAPAPVEGEGVAVDPMRDLYGSLLFHGGRFRRIRRYRMLRATECVADIAPADPSGPGEPDWYGWFVPRRLVLGDPAARDAAIHAVQACIPHARVLPVGVERIRPGRLDPGAAHSVHAVERSREGDFLTYDLAILGPDGRTIELWEGLRLKVVEPIAIGGPWNEALLGPYLERRLAEVVPGSRLRVALLNGGIPGREARTKAAVGQALGSSVAVLHRPDGKPEAPETGVSASHAGDLTLAVAGRGPIGCDLEPVAPRDGGLWRDLLGPERFRLADLIRRQAGEDLDTAATRVWTAIECLKKAGAPAEAPLVLGDVAAEGWIVLRSGRLATATVIARARGVERPLAIGILGGSDGLEGL